MEADVRGFAFNRRCEIYCAWMTSASNIIFPIEFSRLVRETYQINFKNAIARCQVCQWLRRGKRGSSMIFHWYQIISLKRCRNRSFFINTKLQLIQLIIWTSTSYFRSQNYIRYFLPEASKLTHVLVSKKILGGE